MEMRSADGMQISSIRLVSLFYGLLFIIGPGGDCDVNSPVVVAHLEKLAGAIPIVRFESDTVVKQQVDKANSISKYTLFGDTEVLYERSSNDKNKDVVILTSEEDNIPFTTFKKIYVVLKRKPDSDTYFVNLALLRLALEKETENVVELSGKKLIVEWERFDEHFANGRPSITFFSLQCASSFLVPCSFNDTILTAEEKAAKAPKFVGKNILLASMTEIESHKPEVENGADPLCNGYLFYDLAWKQAEGHGSGRGFFQSSGSEAPPQQPQQPYAADVLYYPSQPVDSGVGILGGVLSGIGGVVCGIVSFLASCADERAHHYTMPIGMAAKEGWDKNTWQIGTIGRKRRRRRSASADLEVALDYPGWKTQYKTPKKGILSESSGIFYGFGHCPYKLVDAEGLKKTGGSDLEVVDYYLTALRADCVTWMREFVIELIKSGYLVVTKDKGLEVNTAFALFKEPKLSLKESLLLSSAAELDAFSKIFSEESSNPTSSPKSPDGKIQISKSVNFIVKTGLKALERTLEYTPSHITVLRRHLLQSFKQVFTKLWQDLHNLDRCTDDCGSDKENNRNDRLQVMGLIQFIRYGSGAIKTSADVKPFHDKFYTKNFNSIEKIVDLYG